MDQRIKDISLSQAKDYSFRLAHKVSSSGWIPDHILYVERAGLFIGHVVSRYFDCIISGIYCGRSGNSLKSNMKIIFRLLPRTVTHLLREIERKSNIHSIYEDRNVYIEGLYPPQGKNLLIVDDAIDTGHSAKEILSFLLSCGYLKEQIKIAVLINTYRNSECWADISLFDQVKFAFPWSYDSREYNRAWKLYDEYKSSIV
jgi:hypoxanthine phosphoribosyltransferase